MLRQLLAILAAALVVAAVFVWAESFSSSFQSCISQETSKGTAQNSSNQNNTVAVVRAYSRCTERFIDIHNSMITALATVLLATITFGLVYVARLQIKTTEVQLRAYVFAKPISATLTINQGRPNTSTIAIRCEVKNWGQTPAYNIRNATYLSVMPWPLPRDTTIQSPVWDDPRSVTLAPQETMFQDGTDIFRPPAAGERYYVIGLIEYFDAFRWSTKRTTKFCFAAVDVNNLLIRPPCALQVSRDITFEIAPQHNEAN